MVGLENNLMRRLEELKDQVHTIKDLEPISHSGPLTSILLEHTNIQHALRDLLLDAKSCPSIRSIKLESVLEGDIEFAVAHLPPNLESFVVDGTAKSQNLHCRYLHRLLQLKVLKIDTRVSVHKQSDIQELCQNLRGSHLTELNLHLLPRCSISSPNLDFSELVSTLGEIRSLKVLELRLGYDHNPYPMPLIKPFCLYHLQRLETLSLENFGLGDNHLQVITEVLKSPSTALRKVSLCKNHYHLFSRKAVRKLLTVFDGNHTLEQLRTDDPIQDHLEFWCLMNRSNARALPFDLGTAAENIRNDGVASERTKLSALFQLIRSNPSLLHH